MGPMNREYSDEADSVFRLVPSRHSRQGIFHYAHYRIDPQKEVTTPANRQVDILFVMRGGCVYEGFEVKRGDVFVHGMNKNPVTSFSTDIELFVIGTRYDLLYRKFGIMPSAYQSQALKLPPEHLLCVLGRDLFQKPREYWAAYADDFMEIVLKSPEPKLHSASFACALRAARNLEERGCGDEEICCREFGISRRQLQRQFVRFFGFTLRDYERLLRFSKAFCGLGDQSLADTALSAGYYDQAHMNREFRQMAGLSPQSATKHTLYTPLKETIQRRDLTRAASDEADASNPQSSVSKNDNDGRRDRTIRCPAIE